MGEFSGVLLIRALIPCMKALSSRAYHLQKAPPLVPAHWGLESQHMNLEWEGHKHSGGKNMSENKEVIIITVIMCYL